MIGYVTLGTKDIKRAAGFYDALLKDLGAKRTMDFEKFIVWGLAKGPGLALTYPYDGKPCTVGNGVMVAIAAKSQEQVAALHKKAMELGARDEGAPGPRGEGFYAAYFRDLDGNKLNFFFMG